MFGKKLGVLAVAVVGMLSAVGCCEKEKNEIKLLTSQNGDLKAQNDDLRSRLAASTAKQAELYSQVEGADAEIASLRDQIARQPKADPTPKKSEPVAGGASGWEKGLTGDRLVVGSDILFASGKADLTPAGQAALDKVVADLKRSYAGMSVRVYGYTDTDPIQKTKHLWKDNLDLSANRAMAVTRYLVSKGVKATAIETVAMGEWHPAGSKNASRRVEIIVLKK